MKQIKKQKVLIIGAGFGGIALAKGLAKNSDKFKISLFERDESKKSRSQGYTLGLQQDGLDCLYEKLDFTGHEKLFSKDGATGLAMFSTFWKKYPVLKIKNVLTAKIKGERYSVLIDRSELRSSLLDQLPTSVDVNYDKKFQRYEENEEGVTVYFDDGTKVEGDILIGADGANSLVRKQRCPELKNENLEFWQDGGFFSVDEKISKKLSNNYLFKEASQSLARKSGLNGTSLLSFYDSSAGKRQFFWSLSARKEVANEFGFTYLLENDVLKEKSKKLALKYFDEEVCELIELTKLEDMYKGNDLFSIDAKVLEKNPLSKQPRSRVTLVGDSAHKTTTHAGIGATHALKDAVFLSDHLCKTDDPIEALRNYEVEMSKRGAYAINTSVGMTKRIHERSSIKNFLFFSLMLVMGFIIRIIQFILKIFGK